MFLKYLESFYSDFTQDKIILLQIRMKKEKRKKKKKIKKKCRDKKTEKLKIYSLGGNI